MHFARSKHVSCVKGPRHCVLITASVEWPADATAETVIPQVVSRNLWRGPWMTHYVRSYRTRNRILFCASGGPCLVFLGFATVGARRVTGSDESSHSKVLSGSQTATDPSLALGNVGGNRTPRKEDEIVLAPPSSLQQSSTYGTAGSDD